MNNSASPLYRLSSKSIYGLPGLIVNHLFLVGSVPYYDRPIFEKLGPEEEWTDDYPIRIDLKYISTSIPIEAIYLAENELQLDAIMLQIIARAGLRYREEYMAKRIDILSSKKREIKLSWNPYIIKILYHEQ